MLASLEAKHLHEFGPRICSLFFSFSSQLKAALWQRLCIAGTSCSPWRPHFISTDCLSSLECISRPKRRPT